VDLQRLRLTEVDPVLDALVCRAGVEPGAPDLFDAVRLGAVGVERGVAGDIPDAGAGLEPGNQVGVGHAGLVEDLPDLQAVRELFDAG